MHNSTQKRSIRNLLVAIFLVCIISVAGFLLFFSTHPNNHAGQVVPTNTQSSIGAPTTAPLTEPLGLEQSILDNIKTNGFDVAGSVNRGLGGLWINWKYGTSPLQTNINGSGETDVETGTSLRHDPLTDIRYLHALWLYKAQNPGDHRYDDQITKFTPIVKMEYANTHDERGWLYDEELMDLFRLSKDSTYQQDALSLIASYSNNFKPAVGTIYKVSPAHPQGYYAVDLVLEAGCDLIMAGTQFNHPEWVQQGNSIVNFVYAHAYISQYHVFPNIMDQVLLPNGQVNPNEMFLSGSTKGYTVSGGQFRMGNISQEAISLLHTYQITHEQLFLSRATELLGGFSLPQNALGMWDTQNLGYFIAGRFSNASPANPGTLTVASHYKEAGRQTIMLEAFHLANQFTHGRYQNMEKLMGTVVLTKAYYAPGHGVLYEVNANWVPYHGQDWVTTEAMGTELEALFAYSGILS